MFKSSPLWQRICRSCIANNSIIAQDTGNVPFINRRMSFSNCSIFEMAIKVLTTMSSSYTTATTKYIFHQFLQAARGRQGLSPNTSLASITKKKIIQIKATLDLNYHISEIEIVSFFYLFCPLTSFTEFWVLTCMDI